MESSVHICFACKGDYEREDEIGEMIQQRDRRVRYEKEYKEAKERKGRPKSKEEDSTKITKTAAGTARELVWKEQTC